MSGHAAKAPAAVFFSTSVVFTHLSDTPDDNLDVRRGIIKRLEWSAAD